MPTQPQDNKPAKGEPFKFRGLDGKQYRLPSAKKGAETMTGRDMRDAIVNGEVGQTAYLFKVLEASKPTPSPLDALYSLPQAETMQIVNEWAQHGDGDGASLGE